jgi:hypothetical protein
MSLLLGTTYKDWLSKPEFSSWVVGWKNPYLLSPRELEGIMYTVGKILE